MRPMHNFDYILPFLCHFNVVFFLFCFILVDLAAAGLFAHDPATWAAAG